MAAGGAVLSNDELVGRVWDENADPFTNSVRMTVLRLRRKLGRPAPDRDREGSGLPRMRAPRLTVRARLTALYALLVAVSTGTLLPVSYWLLGRHFDRTLPAPLADDALGEVAVQYLVAFAGVVLVSTAIGWVIAGRVLAPLKRINTHRPASLGGAPRRAHRDRRPAGRAARPGRDAQLHARPARRLVRGTAPFRRQREPRAAQPADRDPLGGRGGAGEPTSPTWTSCAAWASPSCRRAAAPRRCWPAC